MIVGVVEQFRQAFDNVLTTRREAGGEPENLVWIAIYLTDIPDYQAHGREIGAVWRELAGPGRVRGGAGRRKRARSR